MHAPTALHSPRSLPRLTQPNSCLPLSWLRGVLCRQWLSAWSVIAAHCRSYEPSCLSYELFHDEKEPDSAIIFERYVTEEDLTVTHRQSAPFLELRRRATEGQWVKESKSRGHHEAGIGFVSRAEAVQ